MSCGDKISLSNSKEQSIDERRSDENSIFLKMCPLNQAIKTSSVFILLILISILMIKNVQSQKYQREEDVSAGERVEKLASAVGDLYQPSSWYQQAPLDVANEYQIIDSIDGHRAILPNIGFQQPRLTSGSRNDKRLQYLDLDGSASGYGLGRNYRALADDFKQSAQLSNPLREGRAFKPKLMSTARGFGKRADNSNDNFRVSLADLLASANTNEALNGKMSGNAIR